MNSCKQERVFAGNGVSPGFCLGTALKLDSHARVIIKRILKDAEVEEEVRRFRRAIDESKKQLAGLRSRLEEKVGKEHGFLLDVHILMLEDQSLLDEIESIIRRRSANAEWAVRAATDRIQEAYRTLKDEYFRARGSDIENVVERILFNLAGHKPMDWDMLPDNLILVAHDLSPSIFATMNLQKVRGIALEAGGRTTHSAILARSLQLPAVMEIRELLPVITGGESLLVNGDEGFVVLHPSEERCSHLMARPTTIHTAPEPARDSEPPSVTKDGTRVSLLANIELPHEVRAARVRGAEGIGLFRSEFLFFAHPRGLPNADEQLETYRLLVEEMRPHPVAVRTLDTGADKVWIDQDNDAQPNPSLGLRGIRLSLVSADLFTAQIEAILRARRFGNIEIVLPMVSTVEEVWAAKDLIDSVCSRLRESLGPVAPSIPIGAMIEVPAAVLVLDSLAREVDFLCVGTNDLTQYLLAVDRDNPQVSHLFQPLHPSVLQCLHRIAEVAEALQKPARICGEISSNPFLAVLLIGMGYRHLSMNPFAIPIIRRAIADLSLAGAAQLAREIRTLRTAEQVANLILDAVPSLLSVDLNPFVKEIRTPDTYLYSSESRTHRKVHLKKPMTPLE